jgi:four helix bundle protein
MRNREQETGNEELANEPEAPADSYRMKGDEIADRLVGLAVAVIRLVDALPDTSAGKHVAGQLLRAGTSPGANYEEARGAESKRHFLHKIGVTLKELQETRYWLRVVAGSNLLKNQPVDEILGEAEELCRIIGASKRTLRVAADNR